MNLRLVVAIQVLTLVTLSLSSLLLGFPIKEEMDHCSFSPFFAHLMESQTKVKKIVVVSHRSLGSPALFPPSLHPPFGCRAATRGRSCPFSVYHRPELGNCPTIPGFLWSRDRGNLRKTRHVGYRPGSSRSTGGSLYH
ncbi:hypothetical protein B0T20DRAFT_89510 [Sordaria brevicollis]|uniref:Uncharacterized protein n=1 Tax=Sordaria brevicollis TaxID=83679 RepID=A0AAE0U2U8_SORBR|nr:hypothetical protein B0T20DRAFT_89510 [Sordaria brevicollis]